MKTTFLGRIVLGASAVLYGILTLMWHDPETAQNLQHIWKLPAGTVICAALLIALIAGGIGMQFPRTVRLAALVLIFVFLCFSLACIPDIIAAENIYERYACSFFLFFSLVCGAVALLATAEPGAQRSALLGRLARYGLGLCAISFTLGQVILPHETAGLVPKWIPPSQMFWAVLTTIAFALAALAILTNRKARLAMGLMTLMLALFGLIVWVPRVISHPEMHFYWSEFALNFMITGASWMVAELKAF
jgi:uncharacterized membrane protein YphA (DoxX/SURF4 family)